MSMIKTQEELDKENWVQIAGFVEDKNKILESFKGKTIKSIEYEYSESEALIISLEDGTRFMIESYGCDENSDWCTSWIDVYVPRTDDMTEYGFLKKNRRD